MNKKLASKIFIYFLFISFITTAFTTIFVGLKATKYFHQFAQNYEEYHESFIDLNQPDLPFNVQELNAAIKQNAIENFRIFLIQTTLLGFIFSFFLAILFAKILTKDIMTPIKKLIFSLKQNINSASLKYKPIKPSGPTELKELISTYNKLLKKLNKIEDARQELISDLSHEIRTPITKLQLLLESAQDNIIKPDKEFFANLKNQITYLSALINRLQEIAEVKGKKLNISHFNLHKLVQEVLLSYRQTNALLKNKVPKDIKIRADKVRFAELLDNLISNGLKYSKGEKYVEVGVLKNCLYVKDKGVGIPKSELSKIFRRFYRGKYAKNNKINGSGLGLALVKEIADLHGYKIKIRSSTKGTVFYICEIFS